MKRALLLAAVALFVTGCGRCDFSTVTVYWTFQNSGGSGLDCSQAGVAFIRILIDGQGIGPGPNGTNGELNCDPYGNGVEGITLTGFTSGTYSFEIDGLDSNGDLIFLDTESVSVRRCGNSTLNAVLTAGSPLNVAYSLGGACTAPTGQSPYPTTFIWLHILDANGNLAYASDAIGNSTAFPCSAGGTLTIPGLPLGSYTLQGMEEAEILATNAATVDHYNCIAQSFDHTQSGDTFTSEPLVAQASGAATTCF